MPIVRPATSDDASAIAAIWNDVIRTSTATFTSVEKAPSDIPLPGTIVLAEGDRVLGFARLAPFRQGPGYRHTLELTIYLSPDATGRGYGQQLLDALTEDAHQQNAHSLIAGLSGDNHTAFRFFTRHGFSQVAHIPEAGRKFGRWLDLILLQKIL